MEISCSPLFCLLDETQVGDPPEWFKCLKHFVQEVLNPTPLKPTLQHATSENGSCAAIFGKLRCRSCTATFAFLQCGSDFYQKLHCSKQKTEAQYFRYFRNPCDRDPPTGKFKNLKFFKDTLRILNVDFWGKNVYFWGTSVYFGERAFTFGERTFTLGDNGGFSFFFLNFFLLLGGFGTPWVGGPRRGFRTYLSNIESEPPKRGRKNGAARKLSKSVENIFDSF